MSRIQTPSKAHICIVFIALIFSSVQSQHAPNPISTDPAYYYNLCAPSTCSNFTSLTYPFTLPTPCHFFPMQALCPNNNTYTLHSPLDSEIARVLSINFTDPSDISLFVASDALFACGAQISSASYRNYVVGFKLPFEYSIGTHFNCTAPIPHALISDLQNASCIGCKGRDPNNICYYSPGLFTAPNCETFYVYNLYRPFNASVLQGDLRTTLQSGYEIRYPMPKYCLGCQTSGGRCGAKPSSISGNESASEAFVCFCESSVHPMNCSDGMVEDLLKWVDSSGRGRSRRSTVVLAVVTTISSSVLIIGVIISLLIFFPRWRHANATYVSDEIFSSISTTRFSYSQLKTFTNNFSTKIGEGGFGSVYKGTLHQIDFEVPIAVKILKKSSQTKKQFMNEIATVGSIHHDNLVCVLGYCVEGETHALVYEFMENGSLDKHIYKGLTFKQVFSIALETARGISYLHNEKILHCDVKPPNVLLDSNFSAKVADFGLSKMIGKDHCHFSLTAAQGTPGYAAPEIWLKTIFPVTEKSDVYSYGMMILEMVARRKNYDPEASFSSQVYFPEWLHANIEVIGSPSLTRKHSGDQSFETTWDEEISNEENKILYKRICVVGLWCIQCIPSNRPTTKQVIQMLEGNVEFGIPPRPFPQHSFTNHGSTSVNGIV